MSYNFANNLDNSSSFYSNDRKFLGVAEIINILDSDQPDTQRDVKEMSQALRWIGMDLKLPHLNLTDHQLKSTIAEVEKLSVIYVLPTTDSQFLISFKCSFKLNFLLLFS